MLTKVKIHNFRSILDAEVELQPFTLFIGANGVGKSNFFKALKVAGGNWTLSQFSHYNHPDQKVVLTCKDDNENRLMRRHDIGNSRNVPDLHKVRIFDLNPKLAGEEENLQPNPEVQSDGSGVVQVLDSLKTGDREDLFDTIEQKLGEYIPEIEKLSFIPQKQTKQLQVREKFIDQPVPVSELSEGTRLVIMLLTILYQERPPSLICLEDFDHSLHPSLLEKLVKLCFDLANQDGRPQILATSHNPYLVDQFKGREEAVIVVEKKEGNTIFTPLSKKMEHLGDEEMPLGELWFSGILNGVPVRGS